MLRHRGNIEIKKELNDRNQSSYAIVQFKYRLFENNNNKYRSPMSQKKIFVCQCQNIAFLHQRGIILSFFNDIYNIKVIWGQNGMIFVPSDKVSLINKK